MSTLPSQARAALRDVPRDDTLGEHPRLIRSAHRRPLKVAGCSGVAFCDERMLAGGTRQTLSHSRCRLERERFDDLFLVAEVPAGVPEDADEELGPEETPES